MSNADRSACTFVIVSDALERGRELRAAAWRGTGDLDAAARRVIDGAIRAEEEEGNE